MTNISGNKSIEFPCKGTQHNSHTLADYKTKGVIIVTGKSVCSFDKEYNEKEKKIDKGRYIIKINERSASRIQ
jgi:hypothetical protein